MFLLIAISSQEIHLFFKYVKKWEAMREVNKIKYMITTYVVIHGE